MLSSKLHIRSKGQSMAEFALALPILLLVLFGLLEVGRAVFMFASVTNASREAVRYATAYGVNGSNILHYQNCDEIRNTAREVAFFLNLDNEDIVIEYDTGPDPISGAVDVPFAECAAGETVDATVVLSCGDRVVVSILADYSPIVPLVPQLTNHVFEASSARTFMGVVELSDDFTDCD